MRGMRSASAEVYADPDALPADVAPLLDAADTLFSTRVWWRTVVSNARPPGGQPRFVVCRVDGVPSGFFPLLGANSFTTPYTCLYAPAIASEAEATCAGFARYCRRQGVTRLDSIPAEWPHLNALTDAATRAGLCVRRFDHFGNWWEDVSGLDWNGYLARRPGALRETVRRRLRRAERLSDATFMLTDGQSGLADGIEAFEAVYAKSWKEPEPFPTFNAALIRAAHARGILRLGRWSMGGQPVAVQFWIVEQGRATVLKLAHDEAFKAHSPGTVLTAFMLRHLLDQEGVTSIDFGRGDDPYKKDWASRRRQRIGLLLIVPWRLSGVLALARHGAGRLWAIIRKAVTPSA